MVSNTHRIDSVRASRDGHEFHEAWTARRALQLLMPTDGLVGIAVEGLSSADNQTAASESVEIADLTLYYGPFHTFDDAEKVVVLQFKYSIRAKRVPFRMSDARGTVRKFAAAYRDHKSRHGAGGVSQKLGFNLITNRPVHPSFEDAIRGIAAGKSVKGEAKRQANQFKQTCGFKGAELAEFAGKMMITGLATSLGQSKRQLSRTLVDWSSASDAMARASLGGLRELVRDKAGSAGQRDNVIRRTDVIDALGLQGVEDLFPC